MNKDKMIAEAIKEYGYWNEAPEIEAIVIDWILAGNFGEVCGDIEDTLRHKGLIKEEK